MRHRVKKIKVRSGKDANRMLMRKLVSNFLIKGSIRTTLKKAKMIRPVVEKLVTKAKENTESGKNYLLKYLGQKKLVSVLLKEIAPRFTARIGGYVRITKSIQRESDGSHVASLKWVDTT